VLIKCFLDAQVQEAHAQAKLERRALAATPLEGQTSSRPEA
jgi:hypothetical protein